MPRYYNVWHKYNQHWTDYNYNYFGAGYGAANPKRLTLDEAKALLNRIITEQGRENEYIVLEMDADGKAIVPKCRK